jgi:hypothetical protein
MKYPDHGTKTSYRRRTRFALGCMPATTAGLIGLDELGVGDIHGDPALLGPGACSSP